MLATTTVVDDFVRNAFAEHLDALYNQKPAFYIGLCIFWMVSGNVT